MLQLFASKIHVCDLPSQIYQNDHSRVDIGHHFEKKLSACLIHDWSVLNLYQVTWFMLN